MSDFSVEELSEEEIEAVLNSAAFQKAAKYRRLAQGIEVLKEDDAIYQNLVSSITTRHGSIRSKDSIEEALDLLVDEIETYTADLGVEPTDTDDEGTLDDLFVDGDGGDER
ncbi:hypothetical protein [Halobaculum gomorrense]|uniref:Uncharacterized protein n=1 Tax=Halobaculum gomorrense TaxID=43928 RepID=A0A1M5MJJ7_9EURY|nr:hypothetical protein [Halobaculum gomorrense]SHG77458.1 hypothetical protein SAMN05443636_1035 [Halobaculum gomorrense]